MPLPRSPRLAVAAIFALNGGLFGVWASRIPAFVRRFDLTEERLALLLLCIAGGAILAFQAAGRLSDRHGADWLGRRAIALYLLAFLALPLWPNVWLLAAGLALFGATYGAADVAMNAWAAEVERAAGRPIMSSFHAMYSLAAGLGAGSGWIAVALSAPPGLHFWVAGLAAGAATAALATAPWTATTSVEDGPAIALPRGPLILVGLIGFASAVGEGAMADWSAVFLVEVTGTTEARAALGFAAFSTTMVVLRLVGDRVLARIGAVAALRLSGLAAAAGIACLVAAPGLGLALAGYALLGMGFAVVFPVIVTRAAAEPGVPAGRAIAGVATLGYGGMLFGPALIGGIAALTSLPAAFGLIGALGLLMSALAPAVRRP